ncbi:hypothetical protein [Amycolatopsis antarctica]|uniref:hypothetical protein n=1 Tax=Amycolatopsis antarctica TaxID=1854586 RepID=UPI0013FE0D6F|nr:hypothetical protein [Amycolatopsis antarctica]
MRTMWLRFAILALSSATGLTSGLLVAAAGELADEIQSEAQALWASRLWRPRPHSWRG